MKCDGASHDDAPHGGASSVKYQELSEECVLKFQIYTLVLKYQEY